MKNRNGKIFVFGDSHALFWDGTELPNTEKLYSDIIVYHLGPILAWNATEKALPEIRRILNDVIKRSSEVPDYVFLSLGEIDVRTGRPHPEECAMMLFSAADQIADEFDLDVVMVTPPPPSDEGVMDPAFPRVGEIGRREFRTSRFTGAAETYAGTRRFGKKGTVRSLLLMPILNGAHGIFSDGSHLNRKALEKIIETQGFYKDYFINRVS